MIPPGNGFGVPKKQTATWATAFATMDERWTSPLEVCNIQDPRDFSMRKTSACTCQM